MAVNAIDRGCSIKPMHPLPLGLPSAILCGFALVNPIVTQMGFLFPPPEDALGLSLLQVFQGVTLLTVAVIGFSLRTSATSSSQRFGSLLAAGVVCCSAFLMKRALTGGSHSPLPLSVDIVWSVKLIFWMVMWWFSAHAVRNAYQAQSLMVCIVMGAVTSALFIIVGYSLEVGQVEAYSDAGVQASTGAEGVSTKALTGYLAPCLFLAVYLGRSHHKGFWMLMALVALIAIYLTYVRSAQVAMIAGGIWLLVWRAFFSPRNQFRSWSSRIVIRGTLSCAGLIGYVGLDSLEARWTNDVNRYGMVGSGRLVLYEQAWTTFRSSSLADFTLGVGYAEISPIMYRVCGREIHAHSDFFDLILIGGVVGLLLYAKILRTMFTTLYGIPKASPELALMGAVLACYVIHSTITGQLEATHAMFCNGAILHCSRLMAGVGVRASSKSAAAHCLIQRSSWVLARTRC